MTVMGGGQNNNGGAVLSGVSSGLSGLLSGIEASLQRIHSTLQSIDTDFMRMKANSAGTGAATTGGSGGTGAGTPAARIGQAGIAAAGVATTIKGANAVMGGIQGALKDAIPTLATALTNQQLGFNFGMYTGQGFGMGGRPLFQSGGPGTGSTGLLPELLRGNRGGASSGQGYTNMLAGFAQLGFVGTQKGGMFDLANSWANMYKNTGLTNEQAVGVAAQMASAESNNMATALGYGGTRNLDGTLKTPQEMAEELLRATFTRGSFGKKDLLRQVQPDGALAFNAAAAGMDPAIVEQARVSGMAAIKYRRQTGEDFFDLSAKKQQEFIEKYTDMAKESPAYSESTTETLKALLDLGLTREVFDAWDFANREIQKYLVHLSELPAPLKEIAKLSAIWGTLKTTEGGALAVGTVNSLNGDTELLDMLKETLGLGGLGGKDGPSLNVGGKEVYLTDVAGPLVDLILGDSQGHAEAERIVAEKYGYPYDENSGSKTGWEQLTESDGWNAAVDWLADKLPGRAEGDWNVSKNQISKIHQGEMVLPSRIAESVRKDLLSGGRPPQGTPAESLPSRELPSHSMEGSAAGGSSVNNFTINVSVQQASEAEAVMLARRVRELIDQDQYLVSIGKGHGY